MLGHKHFNRVIIWLNELTKNEYITRNFKRELGNKPAVYFLNLKSKKILKDDKLKEIKSHQNIPLIIDTSLLKRLYKEKNLSEKFRIHCMFLADIYLSLEDLIKEIGKGKLHFYSKTDLTGMEFLINPEPDCFFAIEENKRLTKRYFLDVFDPLPPRMILRRRVRQYMDYFNSEDWQKNTKKPFPQIILVCPDMTSFKYLKRFISKSLYSFWANMDFYLSTWNEIQQKGLRRETLHKVDSL